MRIELADPATQVPLLQAMRIELDGIFDGWARAYLRQEEQGKLATLGFTLAPLPDEGRLGLERLQAEGVARGVQQGAVPSQYHTYDTLTADLQAIAADHPDLTRLASIGQSVQGRELWMMKITGAPDVDEDEPAVAYIAAMHGDEVVGKELVFNLINHLTDGYGVDPRVTALVDATEIWIMPSMNPDGTELGRRGNANWVDLNRDFPDWFADPQNTIEGRQPETRAVMQWAEAESVALSANFHGGTVVANYPFDNNETNTSVFSPTPEPDHPALLSLAETYADSNPEMAASSQFPGGVTNGADWYAVIGGMQDWNYCWYGDFQLTLEVSYPKWPAASTLPGYWSDNLESMMSYLERIHGGVRGVVTDADTGAPLAAEVRFGNSSFPSFTDPDAGDFHRPLLPGSHTVEVTALGYEPQTATAQVTEGPATRHDVALVPRPTELEIAGTAVDDGPGGDGFLDPGETASLAVTVRNLGRDATAVGGRLEPTGWHATVPGDAASFADVPTGAAVESDAPHFQIAVDAGAPAGHTPGFALRWQADGASGVAGPFFLELGQPSCSTTDALDVPQPIADLKTTTSEVEITSGASSIAEVQVSVDIEHTYIGDLEIVLVSPAGTAIVLHDRSGGSANDIAGVYGDTLVPAEPLSALAGESAAGTWVLSVTDHAAGDTGSLVAWGLSICGQAAAVDAPEMRFASLGVEPDGAVRLDWWAYPGLTSYRVYRAAGDASSAGAFADVTAEDGDSGDTTFTDASTEPLVYWLVTGVGPQGEGPLGHFGE